MTNSEHLAHILIVDDDEINRKLMKAQLEVEGFKNLSLADDGADALRSVRENLPDLILMDVMMPEIDGYMATRQIRENFPDHFIPIILVTALQAVEHRVQGIESVANDVISKPFHTEELLARVYSLLALKQTRDALNEERDRLALLYSISQALNAQLDFDSLMGKIVSLTTALTDASKSTCIVLNEDGNFNRRITSRHGEESPRRLDTIQEEVLTEGLTGWVIASGEAVVVPDVSTDDRWRVIIGHDDDTRSVLAVPLLRSDSVTGVLMLESTDQDAFSPEHLDMMTVIGTQASFALENARLFEAAQLERARVEALLNQIGDPVVVTSAEGLITQFNPAAAHDLDLSDSALGERLDSIFNLSLVDLIYRAQERASSVSGEYSMNQGETRRSYNVSVSPIESIGYLLLWQDITGIKESERIRLETERAETQRVKDVFSRYMSPALVERVLTDRTMLDRKERREGIVLFADLRGFTRLTIEHSPDDVMTLLNEFFTEMMEIVYDHEGVIFDIAGDELMIAFNVPYDQPDAAERAFNTALAMQRRFAGLRVAWLERGLTIGMGVGIARGPVMLGHVGGRSRMNYAMVGEAVNIAHRMVELAADGQIVVTPQVMEHYPANFNGVQVVELPPQEVKGRSEPMPVFRLDIS
jgi:class 3 adenylate cyclase/DNA-binding response OmpR family regulator